MDRRSTCTNLVTLKNVITDAMENRSQVDVAYTDFCEAFDKVDHNILLNKLANFGFGQPILRWLKSYLTDRCQFVSIKGRVSTSICVPSGVLQGSQ